VSPTAEASAARRVTRPAPVGVGPFFEGSGGWSWGRRTERSLYERANGYNYEAVKIFMPANREKPVYAKS
jgi:hypothetical protein